MQTATGSIVDLNSTTIEWTIDIRGGNSGSSIIHNGEIVGIVTHCNSGGCPTFPNLGTRIDLSSFAMTAAFRVELRSDMKRGKLWADDIEVVGVSGG